MSVVLMLVFPESYFNFGSLDKIFLLFKVQFSLKKSERKHRNQIEWWQWHWNGNKIEQPSSCFSSLGLFSLPASLFPLKIVWRGCRPCCFSSCTVILNPCFAANVHVTLVQYLQANPPVIRCTEGHFSCLVLNFAWFENPGWAWRTDQELE